MRLTEIFWQKFISKKKLIHLLHLKKICRFDGRSPLSLLKSFEFCFEHQLLLQNVN
jgi:hypothetical protein